MADTDEFDEYDDDEEEEALGEVSGCFFNCLFQLNL